MKPLQKPGVCPSAVLVLVKLTLRTGELDLWLLSNRRRRSHLCTWPTKLH